MITIETKNKALKVANQLRDLLADYSELMTNDEINKFISHQLVHVPTGGELGSLASLLHDVKNEQRCEKCNNLLGGKGRGSKQRFCSDDCRFKFHQDANKKKRSEAKSQLRTDGAGQLTSEGAEGDSKADKVATEDTLKPDSVVATISIESESQADFDGAGQLTSEGAEGDSTADNGGAARTCDFCHKPIEVTSRNPNKRFCSANCRAKASKAAAKLEQK